MNNAITRITKLESRVGDLLSFCEQLGNDNSELRSQLKQLSSERSSLMEQKDKARTQVESMITRLRSMEKI